MSLDESADEVVVERLPPDEAFSLLGHETRLRTLQCLDAAGEPLTFTELRECVGMRDPGQYHYHLGRLDGRFVHETDAGYRLTGAGRRVVGAILSGGFTYSFAGDAVPTDARCLNCDGEVELVFEADRLYRRCRSCGRRFRNALVPPGILEGRPMEAVPATLDRWIKRMLAAAEVGFCHVCDGDLERTVRPVDAAATPDWLSELSIEVVVHVECGNCGYDHYLLACIAVLTRPAVVGFHREHGVDVWETPFWDLDWLRAGAAEVVGREPLRFAVPMSLDGETFAPTFDADLTPVERPHS